MNTRECILFNWPIVLQSPCFRLAVWNVFQWWSSGIAFLDVKPAVSNH